MKTYLELIQLKTFEERFKYCQCKQNLSAITFGGHRILNQMLYHSPQWKTVRRKVIIRDNGCDLGIEDRVIQNNIIIHHLNPITIDQVVNRDPCVFDMNNLICVSLDTHNKIHYGDLTKIAPTMPIERHSGDTKLW